jgi:AIPR protein
VLHDNRGYLTDAVRIPLRLIATQNEAVIEAVIRATNRQTEVRDDQFFAMKDFAKKLEEYFRAFPPKQRLYYERRPHQYDDQSIEKYLIVSHQNLVRAVGAMFLGEPHITTRNFRQLSEKVGKDMFRHTDKCEPYYVAATALSRIEESFKVKFFDSRLKPARYQMMLIMRFLMDSAPLPRMNSNEWRSGATQ